MNFDKNNPFELEGDYSDSFEEEFYFYQELPKKDSYQSRDKKGRFNKS